MSKLRCFNAQIKSKTWYPKTDEPDGNTVLLLTCVLNKQLAEDLKCGQLCYDQNGIARIWEGNIGLPVQMTEAQVLLGDRMFDASLIHKLKVGRKEKATSSDITLHLQLRIHFGGMQQLHLDQFCRDTGVGEFSFIIDPAQGTLDFDAKHAKSDDEHAEDLEGKPAVDVEQIPIEETLSGAALASHREMAETGKRKKKDLVI